MGPSYPRNEIVSNDLQRRAITPLKGNEQMRHTFRQQDDHFFHVETGECAGYVVPLKSGKGFSVHRAPTNTNERDKIAVVKSIDEALPALTEFYETNRFQWKRTRKGGFDRDAGYTMYTAYIKSSFYGVFTVKRQDGRWVATRCTDKLLRNGEEAIFPTAEVAQYVVDLHERDDVTIFPLRDGYSWEDRCQMAGNNIQSPKAA
jgi:hypothetical protein